ncbi:MAG: dicarboxylate/amino acid:cation symporter [Tannerellaceae bacterium]|jgi:Na+/H+-dicarboxylate symporter|nr:dicarboxylate/amino acid:cation symporter [Tannerellaceae bacterium]
MRLHWQILTAVVAGALCGLLLPGLSPYVAWIGNLFMNALSMLIVPILFFSIVDSISGIGATGAELRKLSAKTLACYVTTMLLAIVTGLVLVNVIAPGVGAQVSENLSAALPQGLGAVSVEDIVSGFIPKNIFYSFTQNNTMPVILIAVLVGLALPKLSAEQPKEALTNLFKGGLELTLHITRWVIVCSPVGIFAIVVRQFSTAPDFSALLQTIFLYTLTVVLGLAIHTFVWFPLILRFGFHVDARRHLKNMSTPLLTAFSTASSGATLPLTLHAVEHKDGVSPRVARFVVPLGSAVNMSGTALLECVAVLFIAQAYGVDLSVGQQLTVVFTSLICAIGAAGIPMAALVMMTMILHAVHLPIEGIGLVIGVDRLLDMMRTTVNVYGDTCVAVMVAKSEGETLSIE